MTCQVLRLLKLTKYSLEGTANLSGHSTLLRGFDLSRQEDSPVKFHQVTTGQKTFRYNLFHRLLFPSALRLLTYFDYSIESVPVLTNLGYLCTPYSNTHAGSHQFCLLFPQTNEDMWMTQNEIFIDASFYRNYCNLKEMLKSDISDIPYSTERLFCFARLEGAQGIKGLQSHHLDNWSDEDIFSRRT